MYALWKMRHEGEGLIHIRGETRLTLERRGEKFDELEPPNPRVNIALGHDI